MFLVSICKLVFGIKYIDEYLIVVIEAYRTNTKLGRYIGTRLGIGTRNTID